MRHNETNPDTLRLEDGGRTEELEETEDMGRKERGQKSEETEDRGRTEETGGGAFPL